MLRVLNGGLSKHHRLAGVGRQGSEWGYLRCWRTSYRWQTGRAFDMPLYMAFNRDWLPGHIATRSAEKLADAQSRA